MAQTVSDSIGQVTFPDVPAGRYVVATSREGFASGESLPFTVRGGETQQVLVEMRLDVRAGERGGGGAGQLADGEPAAGGRQRRAERRQDGHPAAGGR